MNPSLYSIYIPRISTKFSKYDVETELSRSFGPIYRIDIVNLGQRPGFQQTTIAADASYYAAFVHLYNADWSPFAYEIFAQLDEGSPYYYWVTSYDGEADQWVLLKNLNPIPDTTMNIHQVAENCQLLEQQVDELSFKNYTQEATILHQKKTIGELESIVKRQTGEIDRIQDVIYQMLGGLFDQNTQMHIIRDYCNFMKFGCHNGKKWMQNKDDIGDESDESSLFDADVDAESSENPSLLESDIENDISIHSSMPSLVSISDSENESDSEDDELMINMPVFDASAVIPIVERIRNSAELCGNN
jgi:uncharacterized coiled-coil protein SlyX